jgi:hypothetical protein
MLRARGFDVSRLPLDDVQQGSMLSSYAPHPARPWRQTPEGSESRIQIATEGEHSDSISREPAAGILRLLVPSVAVRARGACIVPPCDWIPALHRNHRANSCGARLRNMVLMRSGKRRAQCMSGKSINGGAARSQTAHTAKAQGTGESPCVS